MSGVLAGVVALIAFNIGFVLGAWWAGRPR